MNPNHKLAIESAQVVILHNHWQKSLGEPPALTRLLRLVVHYRPQAGKGGRLSHQPR